LEKFFRKLVVPVAWTIFIQVLFCLPGSALPETDGFFKMPNFDKLVHVILIGVFVGLWCFYFSRKALASGQLKNIFFIIYLIAVFNGIIIEYIQSSYIPNRSFDQGDIIADVISAGIAYGICNVKLLS
jgi:VanZ family protein